MSAKTFFGDAKVTVCPINPPIVVSAGDDLGYTVELMRRGRRGYALVCEGGKLKGLFTEWDYFKKVVGKGVSLETPIREFMRSELVTLSIKDRLVDVLNIMEHHDFRRVPLVDMRGRPLGMISVFDFIQFLAEHFPAEVGNLPPSPDWAGDAPEGE
ncbi:MAG: CBS domain-containing protein [Planctomycetota bacterium]